eukprot:357817-Chlamydomonas_euryale.AAC.1
MKPGKCTRPQRVMEGCMAGVHRFKLARLPGAHLRASRLRWHASWHGQPTKPQTPHVDNIRHQNRTQSGIPHLARIQRHMLNHSRTQSHIPHQPNVHSHVHYQTRIQSHVPQQTQTRQLNAALARIQGGGCHCHRRAQIWDVRTSRSSSVMYASGGVTSSRSPRPKPLVALRPTPWPASGRPANSVEEASWRTGASRQQCGGVMALSRPRRLVPLRHK